MMVADADVLIDLLQGAEPAARRIGLELEDQALVTTAITRFKVLAGARHDRQRRLIAELLSAFPCLPSTKPPRIARPPSGRRSSPTASSIRRKPS
jgi:predicted nucleic acid-binding protein